MKITRHFITIGNRRVHYRKAGRGPILLMAHQSPRSSAEYEPLMRKWGHHFTCIAPDTPGFGHSEALIGNPEIDDYSAALIEFLDALGIEQTAAYGFHSGGVILVNTVRLAPHRFTVLAIGAYALWSPEELAVFDKGYLPPFQPSAYGEHLTWLWNRILEQTWFFPWFDVRDQARIASAHDDIPRVHASVLEMLDSGDAYRAGYGAVVRAPREIPDSSQVSIPVLITADDADPLQAHLSRLGTLPDNWRAEPVPTQADVEAASLAHIQSVAQPDAPALREDANAGFIAVEGKDFEGLIHWQGQRGADTIILHAPGRSVDMIDTAQVLAIDLVGHGLSDNFPDDIAPEFQHFVDITVASLRALGVMSPKKILGEGYSALLAAAVAQRLEATSWGGMAAHLPATSRIAEYAAHAIPDMTPDRHGAYLTRAWNSARAGHFFWPWYEAKAANAIIFDPTCCTAEALAIEHRSLIRARAGQSLLTALSGVDRDALIATAPPLSQWEQASWAAGRDDIWKPSR